MNEYNRNKIEFLRALEDQCRVFIRLIDKAREDFKSGACSSIHFAAVKRASMDLTRKLAVLRKPNLEWHLGNKP